MTPAELFDEAVRRHRAGEPAAAEVLFRRTLDLDPHHAGAALRLGLLLLQTDRPAEAVGHLERATRLDPTAAAAHHNLGSALRRAGHPDRAAGCYRQALALAPGNPETHANLAVALEELGRPAEAVEHYREAARLDPGSARAANNLGAAYSRFGRPAEAEACFRRAVELAPDYPVALANLANALSDLGRPADAAGFAGRALALRPADPALAYLYAAAAGERGPPTAPPEYVVTFFDRYAAGFDAHLAGLNYRGPELLRRAVPDPPVAALDVLDLGCGTGLCGAAFREAARTLTGVDVSANMLARAAARGVYDRLVRADIRDVLRAEPAASYDLVLAADVFIYVGDLSDVIPGVARVLRPGGRFAAAVESYSGDGYVLRPSRRYAHSPGYLRGLAAAAGLVEVSATTAGLRLDQDGTEAEGLVAVYARPGCRT
jgi:predicted TPR repeat methyltransferase